MLRDSLSTTNSPINNPAMLRVQTTMDPHLLASFPTGIPLQSPNLPPTGDPTLPLLERDTLYNTADAGTIAGAVDSAATPVQSWHQNLRSL